MTDERSYLDRFIEEVDSTLAKAVERIQHLEVGRTLDRRDIDELLESCKEMKAEVEGLRATKVQVEQLTKLRNQNDDNRNKVVIGVLTAVAAALAIALIKSWLEAGAPIE